MAILTQPSTNRATRGITTKQVYGLAAVCLLLGLISSYYYFGRPPAPTAARTQPMASTATSPASTGGAHPKITMEQMKQMADMEASALIEKSKVEPNNAGLLVQIAGVYKSAHQFKDATGYFQKALAIEPKNVPARTELASCLYYSGDVDGALKELNQALRYDPKDPNSLFNLGMIKYRGKNDPKGAMAAWQELLKTNPNLDRRPVVEKMIAEAKDIIAGKN